MAAAGRRPARCAERPEDSASRAVSAALLGPLRRSARRPVRGGCAGPDRSGMLRG